MARSLAAVVGMIDYEPVQNLGTWEFAGLRSRRAFALRKGRNPAGRGREKGKIRIRIDFLGRFDGCRRGARSWGVEKMVVVSVAAIAFFAGPPFPFSKSEISSRRPQSSIRAIRNPAGGPSCAGGAQLLQNEEKTHLLGPRSPFLSGLRYASVL
jgi:hypothetical protein